ncbi:FAD/NAD(P)-binding domain-containing protein [Wilcoxina mikolae CBS 423.85]|nr:FAD/NAD(P)-binding domain-containing protein [Wilcoxina mikolae CBS 423.85]
MQFSTHPFPASHPLFPSHTQILSYLRRYAADLRHLITFNAHISSITPVPSGGGWTLRFSTPHPPKTYDAIIIASGHYNTPFIPPIPGLTTSPSSISHSINFRSPLPYINKKTLLIGNSASAVDIAPKLLPFVTPPLLQSVRTPSPSPTPPGIKLLPEIASFRADGGVEFIDGHIEHGVEVVLFATGYLYTHPFLPPDTTTTGERVKGTWQHIFSIENPTLAYIGLPTRVIPFPCAQSQAAVVAGVWAGKTVLPTKEEMEAWERRRLEEGKKGAEGRVGGEGRGFHNFGYPDDAEYFDTLEGMVPRDGTGLEPTRWRGRERWIRERVAGVKKADLEAKGRGVAVTGMEELGFVYEDDGKEEGVDDEKEREKV